jgi:hypothetical protein
MLVIPFGLSVFFASPRIAFAQKMPAYESKAAMLKIGKEPELPDAEIFHVAYTLKGADYTYQGGHMFYLRKKSRAEMTADVRTFFENPGTQR